MVKPGRGVAAAAAAAASSASSQRWVGHRAPKNVTLRRLEGGVVEVSGATYAIREPLKQHCNAWWNAPKKVWLVSDTSALSTLLAIPIPDDGGSITTSIDHALPEEAAAAATHSAPASPAGTPINPPTFVNLEALIEAVGTRHKVYFACAIPPKDSKRYMVRSPNPAKSPQWSGCFFVTTGSDYHKRKRIGMISSSGKIIADTKHATKILKALAANPMECMRGYGRITGVCGRCGAKLEDPESRADGMGPVCGGRRSRSRSHPSSDGASGGGGIALGSEDSDSDDDDYDEWGDDDSAFINDDEEESDYE